MTDTKIQNFIEIERGIFIVRLNLVLSGVLFRGDMIDKSIKGGSFGMSLMVWYGMSLMVWYGMVPIFDSQMHLKRKHLIPWMD